MNPRRPISWRQLRNTPIPQGNRDHLYEWVVAFLGPELSRAGVCEGHCAPFDAFADMYFNRPSVALMLGPRGGGKSMMSALQTHLECRFHPKYAARIMGGSEQQSRQIYDAINEIVVNGRGLNASDSDTIDDLLKREAIYRNGSRVAILPASTKSSRGPHIPLLMLDEIDEIKRDIFSSAVGMAQEDTRRGYPTKIVMTSTWHRENGLMHEQVEQAKEGRFPFYQFCVFEVLEHCPESRSGPDLENCPACPIKQWCHADIDGYGRGVPKAKRSHGHYSIETFIQKARVLGEGAIVADYLCEGPRPEGVWFRTFSADNVAPDEEGVRGPGQFHSEFPVHIPIDYGVCTAALAFQVRRRAGPEGISEDVHIFGEYYSDGLPAAENARAIRSHMESLMYGRRIEDCIVLMDPAGGNRDPIGPTGLAEYARGGIKNIRWWPRMQGRKLESLRLVESFVKSGTGQRHLFIHPSCKLTIQAFRNYSRRKVGDIFLPVPQDPQHPFEDMIDALAGGLLHIYPNGREARRPARRVHVAGII